MPSCRTSWSTWFLCGVVMARQMIQHVGGYSQVPTFRIGDGRRITSQLSALTGNCRRSHTSSRPGVSSRYLGQRPHDVFLDRPNVGLVLLKRAGRGVSVEVAVEVDLVANDADFS